MEADERDQAGERESKVATRKEEADIHNDLTQALEKSLQEREAIIKLLQVFWYKVQDIYLDGRTACLAGLGMEIIVTLLEIVGSYCKNGHIYRMENGNDPYMPNPISCNFYS